MPGSKSAAIPAADGPSEHLGPTRPTTQHFEGPLLSKICMGPIQILDCTFLRVSGICWITWQILKPIDGSRAY